MSAVTERGDRDLHSEDKCAADGCHRSGLPLSDVCAVVLSHCRSEKLEENIPSLIAVRDEAGLELVVVDNASTDGSAQYLGAVAAARPDIRVILNDRNAGVAEGRNIGAREAKGDYILFLDDDSSINLEGIRELRAVLQSGKSVGVVTPRVVHALTGACQNDHGSQEREVGNYHGSCHMVNATARREVGDIDPLCSFGGEELDYSIRMRAHGWGVRYVPAVTSVHDNVIRPGVEGRRRRQMRAYNIPRLLFKHFPLGMATTFAMRYCVSIVISGARTHGPFFAATLPLRVVRGALEGRQAHNPIPAEVSAYYADASTRPDMGNVPLMHKVIRVLRRRRTSRAGADHG